MTQSEVYLYSGVPMTIGGGVILVVGMFLNEGRFINVDLLLFGIGLFVLGLVLLSNSGKAYREEQKIERDAEHTVDQGCVRTGHGGTDLVATHECVVEAKRQVVPAIRRAGPVVQPPLKAKPRALREGRARH